ncbi:hypothetical protein BGZ81_003028 [Podila clonocystis]|nr:hypothetical protein BGZ81_003028 [Podila clonocystis]
MLHPLALPEIVERIGAFLSPQDLVLCIIVNSSWYRTLTPILWRVFDNEMAAHRRITRDSAAMHTVHIRYLNLSRGCERIPIRSTQLRQLTLSHLDGLMDALNLVCTNKQLAEFAWLVPHSSTRGPYKNLVRYALSTVTSLSSLRIDSWSNSLLNEVVAIAGNNPNLKSLVLGSMINLKVGRTINSLQLLNLTELHLESHWRLNPGIECLVRFCPRLSALWFRADSTCPYSALSGNLRECCPVLASLKCIEGSKDSQDSNVLRTNGIMTLVKAPHFLLHLEIPVKYLTFDLCACLLNRHSATLRNVRFYLRDADEEDFMCVNEILSHCPNLISFALDNRGDDNFGIDAQKQVWRAEEISAMLIEPWNCSKLKTLELTGVSPMCYLGDDHIDEGYFEYDSSDEKSHQDNESDNDNDSDGQDHQSSISEETAQDMDVDTDSQWTFDVAMEDGEYKDDKKDGINMDKDEIYDSFMDIDPTPTELAFDKVLELIDTDPTRKFSGAFADWLVTLGWVLQTEVEFCELSIRRDHKRFLIELFEQVNSVPNMDQVSMRGLTAIKAC